MTKSFTMDLAVIVLVFLNFGTVTDGNLMSQIKIYN